MIMGCSWFATVLRSMLHVNRTSTLTPGPKVSQKHIHQSIALPLQACLLFLVRPGAISSLGDQCTCTRRLFDRASVSFAIKASLIHGGPSLRIEQLLLFCCQIPHHALWSQCINTSELVWWPLGIYRIVR